MWQANYATTFRDERSTSGYVFQVPFCAGTLYMRLCLFTVPEKTGGETEKVASFVMEP
jgi:hypothetical protein